MGRHGFVPLVFQVVGRAGVGGMAQIMVVVNVGGGFGYLAVVSHQFI